MNPTDHTIRLSLAPGDNYDFEVKPFDKITVAEYIRITAPMPEGLSPLQHRQETLQRYTGAPSRFIRYMSMDEVDRALGQIDLVTKQLGDATNAMNRVNETLKNWQKEHDGKEWDQNDARKVIEQMGLFCTSIEVEGQTFTAPMVETACFGRWIDLQAQMNVSTSESESYVRALSAMMDGPDGPYPVQREHESDYDYDQRATNYTQERQRLFMDAPWVKVMGCAAFFFSRSQRFAAITGHSMKHLNSLLSPKIKRERIVIPSAGAYMPS